MISDQGRDTIWQQYPEELKDDGERLLAIRGIRLLMLPGSRGIPMAAEVVEASMMDLVSPKVGHISLLLTQEPIHGEVRQPGFFKRFSQDGLFRAFIRLKCSCRDLYPRFWGKGVTKDKQTMTMGNVGKYLLNRFHRSAISLSRFVLERRIADRGIQDKRTRKYSRTF
jgi:hypothetical protein